ncbi:MAG TPA: flagellin [Gemmatirosa sp.]|jgi:flagellin|nr:flagellin [Gemmatirosa sp.]
MRIQTNTAAASALGYARVNAQATERSIGRLSSGFRINRAADDAAGLALANKLRADNRALGQAQRNAQQANSMLQIMDGATQTVASILDRMKELATQANSANSGDQTDKLDAEFKQLVEEIDRIVLTTKYQGSTLLDGSATSFKFQVSSSGQYASNDQITLSTTNLELDSTTLGVNASTITGATNTAAQTAAQAALTAIDTAINTVNKGIGDIGAAQSRVDFASANVATMLQNSQAAESTIRDADMAYEMTQFTKNNILQQAAQSMLSQANQGSQGILQLLRG